MSSLLKLMVGMGIAAVCATGCGSATLVHDGGADAGGNGTGGQGDTAGHAPTGTGGTAGGGGKIGTGGVAGGTAGTIGTGVMAGGSGCTADTDCVSSGYRSATRRRTRSFGTTTRLSVLAPPTTR